MSDFYSLYIWKGHVILFLSNAGTYTGTFDLDMHVAAFHYSL